MIALRSILFNGIAQDELWVCYNYLARAFGLSVCSINHHFCFYNLVELSYDL